MGVESFSFSSTLPPTPSLEGGGVTQVRQLRRRRLVREGFLGSQALEAGVAVFEIGRDIVGATDVPGECVAAARRNSGWLGRSVCISHWAIAAAACGQHGHRQRGDNHLDLHWGCIGLLLPEMKSS